MNRLKKILYLGLVSLLCLSMIGCSNEYAFEVGDVKFSNQDVEKVESILTVTANYSNEDYLADFKKSQDNKKIKSEVISYMIDNEVVYQKAQSQNIKVSDNEVNEKYTQIKNTLDLNSDYNKLLKDANIDEKYLKELVKKDLVIEKYREEFEEDIIVTDKEIEAYYNKNKEEFKDESLEGCRGEIVNRLLAEKYLQHIQTLRDKADVQRF